MKKGLVIILLGLISIGSHAQDPLKLSFQEYMDWVRQYHPISVQAELNLRLGEMEVRQARGGFDPLIYGNLDRKDYKQSNYFDKREASIVVPTWMGVELNGTFEQNAGRFLNSESNVPASGLLSAGASFNLGQGLVLDERRAALRKAQIFQQATEVERINFLNELNLQAADMYWRWALAKENVKVLQEGVELATFRFNAVKRFYQLGDQAAIDTVEAFTQLLNRQYRLQIAENTFFAASQELSTFLWDEEGNPMELNPNVIPQGLFEEFNVSPDFEEFRNQVISHPELRLTDFEIAGLDVERRLKTQQLLPVVKMKYNFLSESISDFNPSPFFENNYKWGVSFYTPLFLRKTRGAVGLAKAKIEIKQTSRDLKEFQLKTKLESELNNWTVLNQQVNTISQNVKSLEALLTGESRRFEIGESTLFLVNAREVAVIDSRLTLNDLASKLRTSYAKTRFAAGLGFDE